MVTIRSERLDEIAAVHDLNEIAFGQVTEAGIVDSIRAACLQAVSLVAAVGDEIVGHILFSPVVGANPHGPVSGMGLGPLAVLPERQRQGIGSALVRAGIEVLRAQDCPFIVVLGHPEYYPRFGFLPASDHGLKCQWDGVPSDAFMVLALDEMALAGVSGTVRYRDEFDQTM